MRTALFAAGAVLVLGLAAGVMTRKTTPRAQPVQAQAATPGKTWATAAATPQAAVSIVGSPTVTLALADGTVVGTFALKLRDDGLHAWPGYEPWGPSWNVDTGRYFIGMTETHWHKTG